VRRREALGFKALGDAGGRVGRTDERERKRNISTKRLENNPRYLPATLLGVPGLRQLFGATWGG